MNKVFKYRIYANQAILATANEWLESCRNLYNLCLEQRIYAWRILRKHISWYTQSKQLTELKKEYPQLDVITRDTLENVLKRLDRAYQSFFRRIKSGEKPGFPRFKGFDRYNSFTFRKYGWKINGKYLSITKIGKFKMKLSRPIEGEIKEVFLVKQPGNKWFVCFVCGDIQPNPLPKTKKIIGIDVGCESFLTDSNGGKIENPRFLKHSQDKLKKQQQFLAHKKRGSNRRKIAKHLIAKTHEKIFNQRKDFHYKVASELLKNNDVICIEKLKSWNTHRTLNKSMRDVAWFQFFGILKAKAEEAGRKIIEVPAKNTSQMCSSCGQIVQKDLSVRVHSCACGLVIDRDFNSAINILRLGQSLRLVSPLKREYAKA